MRGARRATQPTIGEHRALTARGTSYHHRALLQHSPRKGPERNARLGERATGNTESPSHCQHLRRLCRSTRRQAVQTQTWSARPSGANAYAR